MTPGASVRRAAAAQVFVGDIAAPLLDDRANHHLGRVVRLRAGESVIASDGCGRWVSCRYDGRGELVPDGPVVAEAPPHPRLTVAFAPVKAERPEWVVQKLTELGVDRVVVLESTRSVVRWHGTRAAAAMDRLVRVATEAAAQCRRVWLPELRGVLPLDSLDSFATSGSLDSPGESESESESESEGEGGGLALAEPGGPPLGSGVTAVAVGPEGGWSEAELGEGRATVGLGPHILRAETAAIAAGVLLCARRDGTVSEGPG